MGKKLAVIVMMCALAAASEGGAQTLTSEGRSAGTPVRREKAAAPPELKRPRLATPDAMQWISGSTTYTQTLNCIHQYVENGTGGFTSYFGDSNATFPRVGDIYYTSVYFYGLGNPCSGTYMVTELMLPQGTYPAISQQNPVVCYAYPVGGDGTGIRNTVDCPQTYTTGTNGYRFTPLNNNNNPWPVPQGGGWEIQVPVYSTTTMSGIATNSYIKWALKAIDGVYDQTMFPQVGVFVAANTPTVTYPNPSATSITGTTARTIGNVANHYTAGNIFFDIGTTTGYGTTAGPAAVPNTWDSGQFYMDWGSLAPGTTYHWRMRFVHSGGTVTGADQVFTTTGSAAAKRGDFNNDGKTDIVLRNYATGQNALWIMNNTALNMIVDLPALANANYRIEGTADFNADGKNDIVLRNYATGQNALWVMNGTSLSSIVDLPGLPNTAFHIEGTGDFNADGKPDIILRNYTTGQNALWVMNGTSLSSVVDLPALPNTSYKIESAADFNNDGKTDIVLRNYATGQNALWLMNGTSLQSITDLPALANANYRIDGVGDFNADNKPDIILRNYATGQNALWVMNGTALSSIVDLPALANTNFEINGPR